MCTWASACVHARTRACACARTHTRIIKSIYTKLEILKPQQTLKSLGTCLNEYCGSPPQKRWFRKTRLKKYNYFSYTAADTANTNLNIALMAQAGLGTYPYVFLLCNVSLTPSIPAPSTFKPWPACARRRSWSSHTGVVWWNFGNITFY